MEISMKIRNIIIANLVHDMGEWNIDTSSLWLPYNVFCKILAIFPLSSENGQDRCM